MESLVVIVVACLVGISSGWPSLYTDCSVFPELGQPQQRGPPSVRAYGWVNHPPIALLCKPHPPTSFEWCMASCAIHQGKQNCSTSKCTCKEHCMSTRDVCLGTGAPRIPTHYSLPDALSAKPGHTKLLLDGKLPVHYIPGVTHKLTVVPDSTNTSASTWFLIDSGVGLFSAVPHRVVNNWKVKCNGTRAAFVSTRNAPVDLFWTAPRDNSEAVALRLAAATSMGDLSVTASVLNSTAPAFPTRKMGYFCTVTKAAQVKGTGTPFATKQCVSVPVGTHGALSKIACEVSCFQGNGTYFCARCSHLYDPIKDGNGTAFEDLPDSWRCPLCGAPKAAYAKQLTSGGDVVWLHK